MFYICTFINVHFTDKFRTWAVFLFSYFLLIDLLFSNFIWALQFYFDLLICWLELAIVKVNYVNVKDTLKAFDDFRNNQKKYDLMFFYMWKYEYSESLHWDKTQILKKSPWQKTNDTKNALFFLSRAPTHHSFTFNFGFSIFDSVSLFLKFMFLFNKMHGLFDFKTS